MDNTIIHRLKDNLNNHVVYLKKDDMFYYVCNPVIKNELLATKLHIKQLKDKFGEDFYFNMGQSLNDFDILVQYIVGLDVGRLHDRYNVCNNFFYDGVSNQSFYYFNNTNSKSLISPLFIYNSKVCEIGEFIFDKKNNQFILKNYNIFKLPQELEKVGIGLYYKDCFYVPNEFKIALDLDIFSQYKYIPKHLIENNKVILKITKDYSRFHKIKKIF